MNSKRASQGMNRRGIRNMQRGRRDFLTIVGGAGASLLATACGGSSTSKPSGAATSLATRAAASTSSSASAASTSTSAPAAVKTTPAAPVKVSTVSYYGNDTSPAELAFHKKLGEDFHAAFPQYQTEGSQFSSVDIGLKLSTALASNSPPDVVFGDRNGRLPTLWDQGFLIPVNDVMDDIYKLVGGKDKMIGLDRYTNASGDVIGVPFVGSAWVWWYRQDLLQQAGLTPPAGHWDYSFMVKAVKAIHNPPTLYGFGISLARNVGIQYMLGGLILGSGGHFVSPDSKDVLFDSQEVRDAVDVLKELAQYAPPDASGWGNPDVVTALTRGFVGMEFYQGRVFSQTYSDNPPLVGKFSNTILPYNKQPATWGAIGAHGLFKGKNQAGAKELAKFSMQKEQLTAYMLVTPGTYSSAVPAYNTDPSITGSTVLKAYDPKLSATISEAATHFYDLQVEGPGWKSNPQSGAIWDSLVMTDVMQRVIVGKEATKSAVTWGAGQIRDIMKG